METTKAIDELYVPHRLEGETLSQYRWRQKISKLAANRCPKIHGHKATSQKIARGKLIEQVGARQARKVIKLLLRQAKANREGQAQ